MGVSPFGRFGSFIRAIDLDVFELQLAEAAVQSILYCHQFLVSAAFFYYPVLEHNDLIGVAYGG